MVNIIELIQDKVSEGVQSLYQAEFSAQQIPVNTTRKEFEGDYTVVVFPFTKVAKKAPPVIAEELGQFLVDQVKVIDRFNIVKGFLNLVVSDDYWRNFLLEISQQTDYGKQPSNGKKVMVEFSSPNTNKPLHLGHIRNILLGWSCAQILEAAGYEVIKTQIINNRGIAICKSMLSWQKWADGATPETTGIKGDRIVGDYYVKFTKNYEAEYLAWQATETADTVYQEKKKEDQDKAAFFKAYKNDYFNEYSILGQEAKDMLLKWESGDPETLKLWNKMNSWVFAGFDETYDKLGVHFDKNYYESDTYLLGKEIIEDGIEKGILTKEGKRVYIDLETKGLGRKTIIKSDGTSTYTSQDLGTAQLRWNDYGAEKTVYVVGDEQISHFQSVFEILKRLGEPYADGLYHLAYGMVDLPTGKMKTREGTVVDADELIEEVIEEVRVNSAERDTLSELSTEDQALIMQQVGLAALKYFIIKVHPKKRMVFNPKESVDLQGQTGPYIQNAFVRIQSVIRKFDGAAATSEAQNYLNLEAEEKDLIQQLFAFPKTIEEAAQDYDPSNIAQYVYQLAKSYHKFYHDHSILNADTATARDFRLVLSQSVAHALQLGMKLLGIDMPKRM